MNNSVSREGVDNGDLAYIELLCEVEAEFLRLVSLCEAERWGEITDGEMMDLYAKIGALQGANMEKADLDKFNKLQDRWRSLADKLIILSSTVSNAPMEVSGVTSEAVGEVLVSGGTRVLTVEQADCLPIGSLDLGPREMALVERLKSIVGDSYRDDPVLLAEYRIWDEGLRRSINEIKSDGFRAIAALWLSVVKVKMSILANRYAYVREDLYELDILLYGMFLDVGQPGQIKFSKQDKELLNRLEREYKNLESKVEAC